MYKPIIDISGSQFGRLEVIGGPVKRARREYFWKCKCDCGVVKLVRGTHLRNGKTKSCGCVHGIYISVPITHEQLLKMVCYNKSTGLFYWKVNARKYKKGDVAGNKAGNYLILSFKKKIYFAHVIAWFYVTGAWPKHDIDHKNGRGFDNRWANLREATHQQNIFNGKLRTNNTTGFKGVARTPLKFRAYVCGKHVGVFDTAKEAALAYDREAVRMFGAFARTNFEVET